MEDAVKSFLDYTSNFLENEDYNIKLKIDHTFRVMNLCEKIAKSLNLSLEDVNLAKLCGLLHDIGRFEQWNSYKTFVDSKSVDHGDFGAELLMNESFMRLFNSNCENDNLIINVVRNHNKYKLPKLSEREKLFNNIVRDADKIDILYLYTINDIKVDIGSDCFSDEVFKCLQENKLIDRDLKKTKADSLAISLAFVFDINYCKTFDILKDNEYLDKELDIYLNKTTNQKLVDQLNEFRKIVNNYIDRRCSYVR